MPHGTRISPDGRLAYVASMKAETVSIVDLQSLSLDAQVVVGESPIQVGFLPDGSQL